MASKQTADLALYGEVQQFYARQMQLLDDGKVDEWAATFAEDGVFAANAHPHPVEGRAEIAEAAGRTVTELRQRGLVRRHWLSMLTTDEHADGSVRTRCYAMVLETPKGGQSAVHVSTVCADVLIRDGGTLLVSRRDVSRDDLA